MKVPQVRSSCVRPGEGNGDAWLPVKRDGIPGALRKWALLPGAALSGDVGGLSKNTQGRGFIRQPLTRNSLWS